MTSKLITTVVAATVAAAASAQIFDVKFTAKTLNKGKVGTVTIQGAFDEVSGAAYFWDKATKLPLKGVSFGAKMNTTSAGNKDLVNAELVWNDANSAFVVGASGTTTLSGNFGGMIDKVPAYGTYSFKRSSKTLEKLVPAGVLADANKAQVITESSREAELKAVIEEAEANLATLAAQLKKDAADQIQVAKDEAAKEVEDVKKEAKELVDEALATSEAANAIVEALKTLDANTIISVQVYLKSELDMVVATTNDLDKAVSKAEGAKVAAIEKEAVDAQAALDAANAEVAKIDAEKEALQADYDFFKQFESVDQTPDQVYLSITNGYPATFAELDKAISSRTNWVSAIKYLADAKDEPADREQYLKDNWSKIAKADKKVKATFDEQATAFGAYTEVINKLEANSIDAEGNQALKFGIIKVLEQAVEDAKENLAKKQDLALQTTYIDWIKTGEYEAVFQAKYEEEYKVPSVAAMKAWELEVVAGFDARKAEQIKKADDKLATAQADLKAAQDFLKALDSTDDIKAEIADAQAEIKKVMAVEIDGEYETSTEAGKEIKTWKKTWAKGKDAEWLADQLDAINDKATEAADKAKELKIVDLDKANTKAQKALGKLNEELTVAGRDKDGSTDGKMYPMVDPMLSAKIAEHDAKQDEAVLDAQDKVKRAEKLIAAYNTILDALKTK